MKAAASYIDLNRGTVPDINFIFLLNELSLSPPALTFLLRGSPYTATVPTATEVGQDSNQEGTNQDSNMSDSVADEISSSSTATETEGPPGTYHRPVKDRTNTKSNHLLDSKMCDNCNKTTQSSLKPCIKCHAAAYCSRDCQKADMKNHKKVCAAAAQVYAQTADLKPATVRAPPKEGYRAGLRKWQFDT